MRYLPPGMVGLMLALILGPTMLSTASDMNAVATVSIIDLYKRHARPATGAGHYLWASRLATLAWGCYAVISAQYVKRTGSLLEAVNLLGSFFYGGMLGVFVLAFFFRKVRGRGAFWGVLSGEAAIFACRYFTNIAYLWYNVIGCIVVVATFERPECRENLEPVFIQPSQLMNSQQVWSPDVGDIPSASK
ncbi:MAG: Na+/solute symporter [Edaphobacter sp.]|nr:Na+/solute symporter [Edaphobacter sp.]